MCTLTLIQLPPAPGPGVRIACNRDESVHRPPALGPQIRIAGRHHFVMPVDPVSNGTWIGVSDAGLVAVLLNAYPAGADEEALPSAADLTSRGTIIPGLLASEQFDEMLERAGRLDANRFAPFRLVLADQSEVAELHWARPAPALKSRTRLIDPVMFTSSGLGDARVDGPRRRLFDGWFHAAADWPAQQDAFHRHQWPDAPELSVCMNRADARTVSHTVVEIGPDDVTLRYFAAPPNRAIEPQVVRLPVI